MKLKLSEIAAEYEQFRATHTYAELVKRYVGSRKMLGECPVMPTPACMEAILYLLKRDQIMAWRVFEADIIIHDRNLTEWFQELQREFTTNSARFDFSEPVVFKVRRQAIEDMVEPKSDKPKEPTQPRPMAIESLIIKPEAPSEPVEAQ